MRIWLKLKEIIEGLFQYGKTLDEIFMDLLVLFLRNCVSDNIIGDRKVKITRIAEAF